MIMYMRKKFISALLAVCICAGLIAGCGGQNASSSSDANPLESTAQSGQDALSDEEAVSQTESGTHTVVDHAGNEVEVPNEINHILITSVSPIPSVYSLVAGSADKIMGISPSAMATAENSMLCQLFPSITEARTDFMNGSDINVEEIIAMDPDVIFYKAQNTEEYEKLKATGIPAVGFSTNAWGTDILVTFENWVSLLGEVLQEENRATGIAEYGRKTYDMIQARLEEAGESLEKPSIMFIYSYRNGTILTSGSKHWGQYWCDTVGAVNIAGELDAKNPEVNMEQIYQWDPDMIFITNGAPYLAEDLYNNAIEGHDWSVVRAVQEGNVYKNPLGMYRWYPPSSDSPLMLLWMAKTVHPELFEDIDMEQEVKDYYQQFYDIQLTDEELHSIFNPVREAAG